jgi:hypothetical protein
MLGEVAGKRSCADDISSMKQYFVSNSAGAEVPGQCQWRTGCLGSGRYSACDQVFHFNLGLMKEIELLKEASFEIGGRIASTVQGRAPSINIWKAPRAKIGSRN